MPEERARSPLRGDGDAGAGEYRSEEPTKTVYFVPIYAVAVVDPNKHIGKSRLPLDDLWNVGSSENISASQRGLRGKSTEPEVAVEQKRQKMILMRKRGRIPEYDDDDPHKPTPKRLRNRMKAQKSRDKKKAYMNALENKVKELGKMNLELEESCLSLQIKNETLKNEVLESNPGAKEQLMHYYEKLRKDKENALEKPVENQEDSPGKSAEDQAGTSVKWTEITGHEDAHESEFDEEGTPETAVDDQEHTLEEYAEADDPGSMDKKFLEIEDIEGNEGKPTQVGDQEVTSRKSVSIYSQEFISEKFGVADAEGTMRWTVFENNTIPYLEDGVGQHSVLGRSHSSI
uniref:Transcription factor HY5 n=1 Tax=Anthurium amnicola TaxID=1678845 RepID=A0A1D1Y8Q3_9ARAE